MHVAVAAAVGFIFGMIVSYALHGSESRVVTDVQGAYEARWHMLESDVKTILAKVSSKV